MKKIKIISIHIILWLAALALLFGLLVLSASIPNEAIKSNMEEYEEDIRTLDFEHQPRLLEEMRLEIKACRDMIKNYYDEYRKENEA